MSLQRVGWGAKDFLALVQEKSCVGAHMEYIFCTSLHVSRDYFPCRSLELLGRGTHLMQLWESWWYCPMCSETHRTSPTLKSSTRHWQFCAPSWHPWLRTSRPNCGRVSVVSEWEGECDASVHQLEFGISRYSTCLSPKQTHFVFFGPNKRKRKVSTWYMLLWCVYSKPLLLLLFVYRCKHFVAITCLQ